MFEKVNPAHPDKIADRIAGALVDLAYTQEKNPKIAVEVLIGHGICHIVTETSTHLALEDVQEIVSRIAGDSIAVDYQEAAQDPILADNQSKKIRCGDNGIFKDVIPHDIVKFGLIPELVGRVPVIVSLDNLDSDALVRILSEPKNSLTKQYAKPFEMDDVKISFTEDALRAVAECAIERNTGARGLRAILEETMTTVMFEIPSRDDVAEVVITEGCIAHTEEPRLILKTPDAPEASDSAAS